MGKIKWKHKSRLNTWEGVIKGDTEPLIFIEGRLCVTDIRPCREQVWQSPKNYKIIGKTLEEAKQLAEDLVTGDNYELHESNRIAWETEHEKTSQLIKEAQEFLDNLK